MPGQTASQRFWFLFSAGKIKQMNDKLNATPQGKEERIKLIDTRIKDAQALTILLDRWVIAHDIEVLYEKDELMAGQVKKAKDLLKEIDRDLPNRGSR